VTLHVPVPGDEDLSLEHLVLDVNGTLTDRGELIAGVADGLAALRGALDLHALSADTFGTAEQLAERLGAAFVRVAEGGDKRRYVEALGPHRCVAIGNGRNDASMLRTVALGIAVVGPEGASARAAAAADVLARSIADALALLREPKTLTATLRA
jgi:soluble P-type ATPase